MAQRKHANAAVYGIDLGKNVFHIAGADADGAIIGNWKLRRDTLLKFFQEAAPALIGMEACPGSHWLARQLQSCGHRVCIIPAQFVKPYVKSNKNDVIDAAAIAEAVTRPTMRFVEIKTTAQAELQALHRIRDRMVTNRTRLICQMRALCIEFGIAIHQGVGKFKADMPRVLANLENDLTPMMRRLLGDLFGDLRQLEERIAEVTREIEANAARDERSRRLMTVPGIGPLVATAILASAGDGKQFRTARDMAAWLGLVPRQHSTGGKATLLGISRRGNHYLRRLLIHGARSCVMHLDRSRDRLGAWIDGLQQRMHINKVTVALAAKVARVAWVILNRPGAIYERRDPMTT